MLSSPGAPLLWWDLRCSVSLAEMEVEVEVEVKDKAKVEVKDKAKVVLQYPRPQLPHQVPAKGGEEVQQLGMCTTRSCWTGSSARSMSRQTALASSTPTESRGSVPTKTS